MRGIQEEEPNYTSKSDDEETVLEREQTQSAGDAVSTTKNENEGGYSTITYITYVTVGIALVWPWNCLLNSAFYFQESVFDNKEPYVTYYTSSMMTTSTISTLLVNAVLAKFQSHYRARVTVGLISQMLVFVVLVIVLLRHTGISHAAVFALILILVMMSALSSATTQNGSLAIANTLASKYTHGIIVGQAIAGVVPSVWLLIAACIKTSSSYDRVPILVYFGFAVIICATPLLLYRLLPNSPMPPVKTASENLPLLPLIKRLFYPVASIFFVFFITLLFPVFANSTVPTESSPLSAAQLSALSFTIWNVGDLIGRVMVPSSPTLRRPVFLLIGAGCRVFLIPFFAIFTRHPVKLAPSIVYLCLQLVFGITNGFIVGFCFALIPSLLSTSHERQAAAGIANFSVSLGLAAGSLLSFLGSYVFK